MRKPRGLKAPLHLLPARALRAISGALEHGDTKYVPGSWRSFRGARDVRDRYGGAILRHVTDYLDPDEPDLDPESGIPHLAHAGAGVVILLALEALDYVPSLLLRDQADRRPGALEAEGAALRHEPATAPQVDPDGPGHAGDPQADRSGLSVC